MSNANGIKGSAMVKQPQENSGFHFSCTVTVRECFSISCSFTLGGVVLAAALLLLRPELKKMVSLDQGYLWWFIGATLLLSKSGPTISYIIPAGNHFEVSHLEGNRLRQKKRWWR
jgi:hypothetical protein